MPFQYILTLLALFFGLLVGFLFAHLMRRREAKELRERTNRLEHERDSLIQERALLQVRLEGQQQSSRENLAIIERAEKTLGDRFKALAGEIFEEKQRSFAASSKTAIESTLQPLREKITDFQRQVSEAHDKEVSGRQDLKHQLDELKELSMRLGTDAENLTNALRNDSQTRGAWGEITLEKVLEISGLHKGREYETQVGYTNRAGAKRRLDVIVRLPDHRDVVIDAKVSLLAYERYVAATGKGEREAHLAQHTKSLKVQMVELAKREYQHIESLNSLDYVIMFVPIEGAFVAALEHDYNLFRDAWNNNIIIVCPSTLLAMLRTIENIWKYERQHQNARRIAAAAGKLYDKFVRFVTDLDTIGKRLAQTNESYESAMKRLRDGRGNLIEGSAHLKSLGADTTASLPAGYIEDEQQLSL